MRTPGGKVVESRVYIQNGFSSSRQADFSAIRGVSNV